MKKIIFLGAVALFGVMNAQSTKFGIKGGYSLSTLQKESDLPTKEKVSLPTILEDWLSIK